VGLKPIFIFDLAEVLCAGIPGAERELSGVFSVPAEGLTRSMRGRIMDDYCRGKMTEDAFWSGTMEKNGWRGDIEAAKGALRRNLHTVVPGTADLLRELAARGHDLYLLSDHGREWIDYAIGVHDFFKVFKRLFWSFDLGSIKSEPATFEKVLLELGSPDPASVVFVDDNATNVEVARSAGIDAIRFTDAPALRGELTARGLL
jgi:HAD superfamily hydrolase (TIGR01509 family)